MTQLDETMLPLLHPDTLQSEGGDDASWNGGADELVRRNDERLRRYYAERLEDGCAHVVACLIIVVAIFVRLFWT